VAAVAVFYLFDQKINPVVIPAMKTQISMMKPLLAFVLPSRSLLCATYSALACYRLVSLAKGIEPYDWICWWNFFQHKA
jgi:hypothetical protein